MILEKGGDRMKTRGLTGNQLKILAMITMTIDHIGAELFPQVLWLRIVGRLAMPIFAFMIAEGCRHTRNPLRYLGTLAAFGLVCQLVYFFAMGSLYMCILVTFSMSVGLILLLKAAQEKKSPAFFGLFGLATAAAFFLCEILPGLLPHTDYAVDYGFFGVLLPVLIYLGKNKWWQLFEAFFGMVLIANHYGYVQWWSLLALPLLALYNGTRGKWKMKWFFYIFYPAHLVAIHFIGYLL